MTAAVTRRRALAIAAAAPLALRMATPAAAGVGADAAVISELLRAELVMQRSYELSSDRGPGRVRALARHFRAHEVEHTAALAQALEALGARGVSPPRSLADVDEAAQSLGITSRLGQARSARDRLLFLLGLEETVVGLMHSALGRLGDDKLLQTTTTILGCQAQHLVVLRLTLGRAPLPSALDTGRS